MQILYLILAGSEVIAERIAELMLIRQSKKLQPAADESGVSQDTQEEEDEDEEGGALPAPIIPVMFSNRQFFVPNRDRSKQ